MTNDDWGQKVHGAIARHDVAALRRMATSADREETKMWLTLLARMLELDATRKRRHRVRESGLAVISSGRRPGLRRAV